MKAKPHLNAIRAPSQTGNLKQAAQSKRVQAVVAGLVKTALSEVAFAVGSSQRQGERVYPLKTAVALSKVPDGRFYAPMVSAEGNSIKKVMEAAVKDGLKAAGYGGVEVELKAGRVHVRAKNGPSPENAFAQKFAAPEIVRIRNVVDRVASKSTEALAFGLEVSQRQSERLFPRKTELRLASVTDAVYWLDKVPPEGPSVKSQMAAAVKRALEHAGYAGVRSEIKGDPDRVVIHVASGPSPL